VLVILDMSLLLAGQAVQYVQWVISRMLLVIPTVDLVYKEPLPILLDNPFADLALFVIHW